MSKPYPEVEKKKTKQAPPEDKITCIEPRQGEYVYRYYNKVLDETATQRFEGHLLLCFYCQDVVSDLEAIEDALAENMDVLAPAPDPVPADAVYAQALESEIIKR